MIRSFSEVRSFVAPVIETENYIDGMSWNTAYRRHVWLEVRKDLEIERIQRNFDKRMQAIALLCQGNLLQM